MVDYLIAIGSNLPTQVHAEPLAVCLAAVAALEQAGLTLVARSSWYRTAPVPISDQPWFVNGVVRARSGLDPTALLALLHDIEAAFGRIRRVRWEARVLDLDLIDALGGVPSAPGQGVEPRAGAPLLPHPRAAERAFVLLPLRDVAPNWVHPVTGRTLADLIAALPPEQSIARV
jgi:2-amino-4-hydroxy-6-hydroxymethyldihydropteridine diphosphokinase